MPARSPRRRVGTQAAATPQLSANAQPLRGRPLAEQILATVIRIERLPVRRGPSYRRLVLALADLCHGNTRMLGDLLGVSRQAASETLRRAKRDPHTA